MPSNNLILCHPLLLPPSIFPSIRVFSNESILHIRWPKYGVSASASVLTMNIQDWFPLDGLVGSSCSPRDSQEYYPTPKFKCINFSVVSFLYSPTLMSVHDYWKNHSFDSVQFCLSVMSDSLRPHEPPHARLPCPSPTPGVHPNPCPLSQWCHPTISSCCPLLHLPSIFPSIRVFSNESALHIRWSKYWSFSLSIIPSKEYQGWSPLEWTGWLSLQSKGLSRVFSNTTVQKHQFFGAQLLEKCKSTLQWGITSVRMAIIKKSTKLKCWRGWGEKGTLLHCWWDCTLI